MQRREQRSGWHVVDGADQREEGLNRDGGRGCGEETWAGMHIQGRVWRLRRWAIRPAKT